MIDNDGVIAKLRILGFIMGTPAKLCRDAGTTWIGVECEGVLLASVPVTEPNATAIALARALRL